jgi:hypothetical protein
LFDLLWLAGRDLTRGLARARRLAAGPQSLGSQAEGAEAHPAGRLVASADSARIRTSDRGSFARDGPGRRTTGPCAAAAEP